jgi:hypothetical protein
LVGILLRLCGIRLTRSRDGVFAQILTKAAEPVFPGKVPEDLFPLVNQVLNKIQPMSRDECKSALLDTRFPSFWD